MAVASASAERIIGSPSPMESPPSRSASDVASESSSSSSAANPSASEALDRNDQSISSPSPRRDVDVQSPATMRSEEYRKLFHLPPEEVLVQDFNCAFQESILLQGHMYLFVHYVCFYSNIFGFETKLLVTFDELQKIIPFNEITSVKRAKTAGIFPNAIEIFAGGRKYFFASFLSRDEAFKLINDGFLQYDHGVKPTTEEQESLSESNSQDNGLLEKVNSFKQLGEMDSDDRQKDDYPSNSPELLTHVENDNVPVTLAQQPVMEWEVERVGDSESSSSTKNSTWNPENIDAPEVPKSLTRVAETKFPVKVEKFFDLFFSDDAISFIESFHKRCNDREFKCSAWYPHENFGHARDISFQHPIKIYFGTKCGSCKEVQKFRVYRNSHLVIGTSQEVSDVPYGDYFSVEGRWDVVRDGDESNEGCILRIYVGVMFTKKTVFKGKIVQSTLEECRETYALWKEMAHQFLMQKNLEKRDEVHSSMVGNVEVESEREVKTGEASERSHQSNDYLRIPQMSHSIDAEEQAGNPVLGNSLHATSVASLLREYALRLFSVMRSQSQVSLILVVAFAVILLMQVSVLVLLNRPQNVHVASPGDFYVRGMGGRLSERSADAAAWLERRMHHLKDEMFMVESRLERLQQEHAWLKAQFEDLHDLPKRK